MFRRYHRFLHPDSPLRFLLKSHQRVKASTQQATAESESFPGELSSYIKNTTQNYNCTISVVFNPQDMFWIAVPCEKKFSRFALFCQSKPITLVKYVFINNSNYCPAGFFKSMATCVKMVFLMHRRDPLELCAQHKAELLKTYKIDSYLSYILKMWSQSGPLSVTSHVEGHMCATLTLNALTPGYTGHVTRLHQCWNDTAGDAVLCGVETEKPKPCSSTYGLFSCKDMSCVFETKLCDGVNDCVGGEEEEDCPPACYTRHIGHSPGECIKHCPVDSCICAQAYYHCQTGGCLSYHRLCDCVNDCPLGDDELNCPPTACSKDRAHNVKLTNIHAQTSPLYPHYYYDKLFSGFEGNSSFDTFSSMFSSHCRQAIRCNSQSMSCYPPNATCQLTLTPDGHVTNCPNAEHLERCAYFECWDSYKCLRSYCIPWNLVCDGSPHCPSGDDEVRCELYDCDGLVRCGHACIHPSQIGDESTWSGCSNRRINVLIPDICPTSCICSGQIMQCQNITFGISDFTDPHIRVLLVANSDPKYIDNLQLTMNLLQLSITQCKLLNFNSDILSKAAFVRNFNVSNNEIQSINGYFQSATFINVLDLSHNKIHLISHHDLKHLTELVTVFLNHNQLTKLPHCPFPQQNSIREIYLHHNYITQLSMEFLCHLTTIRVLTLTNNRLLVLQVPRSVHFDSLSVDEERFCCYKEVNDVCAPGDLSDYDCHVGHHLIVIYTSGSSLIVVGILCIVAAYWWIMQKKVSGYSICVINMLLAGSLLSTQLSLDVYMANRALNSFETVLWNQVFVQRICFLGCLFRFVSYQMFIASTLCLSIERLYLTKYVMQSFTGGKMKAKVRSACLLTGAWIGSTALGTWVTYWHSSFHDEALNSLCAPFLTVLYSDTGRLVMILVVGGIDILLSFVSFVFQVSSVAAMRRTSAKLTSSANRPHLNICSPYNLAVFYNLAMAIAVGSIAVLDSAYEMKMQSVTFITVNCLHSVSLVMYTVTTTFNTTGFKESISKLLTLSVRTQTAAHIDV